MSSRSASTEKANPPGFKPQQHQQTSLCFYDIQPPIKRMLLCGEVGIRGGKTPARVLPIFILSKNALKNISY
ncbi:hypothetical protein [Nostoc flagelliforme]|uniref:hypothetical protein n=1 Tax=Nostoc flagelliforme TaxID=1306274 RepID=UPI0012FD16CB